MSLFHLDQQGFVFVRRGNVVLIWPLHRDAANWLRLTVAALWPDREVLFFNGAYVVLEKSVEWNLIFGEIYQVGWGWSGPRPPADNDKCLTGFDGSGPPPRL